MNIPGWYAQATVAWTHAKEALRKHRRTLITGLAALSFAGALYAGLRPAAAQAPPEQQAAQHVDTLEVIVEPQDRCETIVRRIAQEQPNVFPYALDAPAAIKRAVNETAARSAQLRDLDGRTQDYVLEDRVRAYGVLGSDGEQCDRIYPGTRLAFVHEQTSPPAYAVLAPSTETTAPMVAIPLAIAGIGAGVALSTLALKDSPQRTTRESYANSARQTQQESKHYTKADRTTYRTERDNLARDMRRAGVSVNDIAETLGVSKSTVYRCSQN